MSDRNLKDLVAIVTGASRGIGKAIALSLAEHGLKLVLVGRDQRTLDHLGSQVQAKGTQDLSIAADLADPEAPQRIVQQAVAHFGQLDVLINNAGLTHVCPFEQLEAEDFDRLMAVNARAPMLLCRHAIAHLKRSPRPTIINVSSVAGHKGYVHEGAYAASKHALTGLTKVLANELNQTGVRVHLISPGGVDTDMLRQIHPDMASSALMRPEDMAEAVLFLLIHRTNAVIDEVRIRRASSAPANWS